MGGAGGKGGKLSRGITTKRIYGIAISLETSPTFGKINFFRRQTARDILHFWDKTMQTARDIPQKYPLGLTVVSSKSLYFVRYIMKSVVKK